MKKEYKYLTLLFLITVVFCGLFYGSMMKQDHTYAIVEYQKEELLRFNIHEDAVYQVEGAVGIMNIEVQDGRFHVFDVDCPNHDCEKMGWIDSDSLIPMIVCLPNEIVITLE
ncbi:MAG: NusG domain II-containing protein [Erysipelotrichales bacterium]|nr:NusG domain II-containing protein [Erysipelotrichales bacterium]